MQVQITEEFLNELKVNESLETIETVDSPIAPISKVPSQQSDSIRAEFDELTANYRKTLSEKFDLELTKSRMEEEIAEKNEKIEQLTKELASSFNDESQTDADVVESLRREIAEKELEIELMHDKQKENQNQLDALAERHDRLAAEIAEHKCTISNLQTIADVLRQSNSALVQEIVAKNATRHISESNENLNEEVEKKLAEKFGDIEALKSSELCVDYADFKALCNALAASREKVHFLEQNLDEKNCKLEEISVDLTIKSKQVASLQTDLGILEYELDEIKKGSMRHLNLIEPKNVTIGYLALAAFIGIYGLKKVLSM